MESGHRLTANYVALIDQIRSLLNRQHVCSNTYLFKHLKTNLTFPLYALAEQRKIAQISNNQQDLMQAVDESGMARMVGPREVAIIDYPTVKISTKNQEVFPEIEKVLKQHEKRYAFSERLEQQYINLTLYEEDPSFLNQLLPSLSKQVEFEPVTLFDDMKLGVARIKKIKAEQKNNYSQYPQQYKHAGYKYSMDKPPQIFIRRAAQSSDEDEEKERPRGRQGGEKKKKKYKEVVKEKESSPKVVLNHDDFPTLG